MIGIFRILMQCYKIISFECKDIESWDFHAKKKIYKILMHLRSHRRKVRNYGILMQR